MRITRKLLSPRFSDNGRANIVMGRSAIKTAHVVSDLLRTNDTGIRVFHKACPLCAGETATLIAEKDRYGIPADTLVCDSCSLIFSGSVFTPEFAAHYYSEYAKAFKIGNRSADDLFKARTAPKAYAWRRHAWVKRTLGNLYQDIKTVIEVGCSDGCNLYPYHLDKKKVTGCDYDEARLIIGRKVGMDLRRGGPEDFIKSNLKADLVIFSHSLEHMTNIDTALQFAKQVMKPTGYLYIEVPGVEGLIRPKAEWCEIDGYGCSNDLLGYLQFEHHYHFNLASLSSFATRNGFEQIAGDEIVRMLFRQSKKTGAHEIKKTSGKSVVQRLEITEKDFLATNSPIRRGLRRLYISGRNALVQLYLLTSLGINI